MGYSQFLQRCPLLPGFLDVLAFFFADAAGSGWLVTFGVLGSAGSADEKWHEGSFRECKAVCRILYPIPNSVATASTFFAASLRDMRRVSFKNWIAFSCAPVLTSPYSVISHCESTPGATGFSHSTRTLPSGMPQVNNRQGQDHHDDNSDTEWIFGSHCCCDL